MKQVLRLVLPLAIVSLFGAGCALFPQVVRVPPPPANIQTPVAPQPAADTTNPIAYLKLNGGAATVTRGDATEAGQEDTELVSGDQIKVSSGTVSLVYPDAGETQLDAGSDVTLVADGPDTGSVFTELQVTAGEVWTRFERLLGANEHFSVQANGVVATVRGTGFGVSVDGDNVDVQVAEHSVDVTSADEESAATSNQAVHAIHLTAGQGFRVGGSQVRQLGLARLKANVRALTVLERARKEFRFGSLVIPAERLRRPLNPIHLKATPVVLPALLQQRLNLLKSRLLLEVRLRGFAAPTIAPGTVSPTIAPLINGPTNTTQ